jgi:hypothetical protein
MHENKLTNHAQMNYTNYEQAIVEHHSVEHLKVDPLNFCQSGIPLILVGTSQYSYCSTHSLKGHVSG